MTFLETLQTHRGGLIRIKSDLFWYGGRGWDGAPGRVCLLLDAVPAAPFAGPYATALAPRAAARTRAASATGAPALLLIDGAPHWVWVARADVEIL